MSTSQLQHNWTPHNCGIEVNSFNLTSTTPQDISLIKSALAVHGCVYFRNSPLTPAQHHNFASSFSTININRFFPSLHEEGIEDGSIALVEKKKEAGSAVGERFHTDHSYDVAPALGSILVARELPQTGGDTVFVDMQKAYETLPNDIKQKLIGMRAVHSSRHVFGVKYKDRKTGKSLYQNQSEAVQDTVHPVVITSPLSGKPSLYVNPGFTIKFEGMTQMESQPFLNYLYLHAMNKSIMHRFQWEKDSVILWDNRSVWHCAVNDYHGQYRLMNRITIDGCKLTAFHAKEDQHQGSVPYAGKEMVNVRRGMLGIGFTELDHPFILNAMDTFEKGMIEMGSPEVAIDMNPKWWQKMALKMLSVVGVHPKL